MMHKLGWMAVRYVIPVVVGLAVLMQALNSDLIVAAFYLNQRYIAENLCENTGRPDMHCNGTCQLKKALQKAAEKEKQATVTHIKVDVQICEHWSEFRIPVRFSSYVSQQYPTGYLFLPSRVANDIFRPPIAG